MVLVDLEAHPAAAPRDLIEAFRLTPAEARLAARLAADEPIEMMAEKLGIAHETAPKQPEKHLSQDRDAAPR
jgi:hypothetical protein